MCQSPPHNFKNGMCIVHDGKRWIIVEFQHVKPGKGGAFVRTKLKELKTRPRRRRTRSAPARSSTTCASRPSRCSTSTTTATRSTSWTTTPTSRSSSTRDFVGDAAKWLKENDEVEIMTADGEYMGVEPPMFVELEVIETDPGFKGDTVQGGTKPATLETGAVVQVPMFVEHRRQAQDRHPRRALHHARLADCSARTRPGVAGRAYGPRVRPRIYSFDSSARPRIEAALARSRTARRIAMRPVHITDTTLRDAHQSLWATRMADRRHAADPARRWTRSATGRSRSGAARRSTPRCASSTRTRGSVCASSRSTARRRRCRCCCAVRTSSATTTTATRSSRRFVHASQAQRHRRLPRASTRSTTSATSRSSAAAIKECGGHFEGAICYTVSPVHTLDTYLEYAQQLKEHRRGHHLHQGHGGHAHAVPHREDGASAQGRDRSAGPRALPLHRRHGADELRQGRRGGRRHRRHRRRRARLRQQPAGGRDDRRRAQGVARTTPGSTSTCSSRSPSTGRTCASARSSSAASRRCCRWRSSATRSPAA